MLKPTQRTASLPRKLRPKPVAANATPRPKPRAPAIAVPAHPSTSKSLFPPLTVEEAVALMKEAGMLTPTGRFAKRYRTPMWMREPQAAKSDDKED